MLEVHRVDVDIASVSILRNAALDLQAGQMVGLIGRNGAGKTTFLRAIMGLANVRSGQVTFDRADITKAPPQRRALLGIGYMPEDRRLVPSMTAEDNITVPAWSVGIPDQEDRLAWIYDVMPETKAFRNRPASSLSGGQQKLVALARALMAGSRLLLLDEPSEGVAPALARRMSEILHTLKDDGLGILIAESNVRHCADLMDRMFAIERGAVESRPLRREGGGAVPGAISNAIPGADAFPAGAPARASGELAGDST